MPFAWLYGGVVAVRNLLYDHGVFKSYRAPIPVVCVGNLSVGGTGKTPQVEFLARLYQHKKIAILSRGYKRKTTGFVLADETASPDTLGDEPFQYVHNLPWAKVAVCEKRAHGIQELLRLFPDLDLILLDDAFQHRAVTASRYLLLTDYNKPFNQDYLLPAGRLREHRKGAKRADAVVVTKCPEGLNFEDRAQLTLNLAPYLQPGTPVFFSQIVYARPVPFLPGRTLSTQVIAVTGIVNPKPFLNHLSTLGGTVVHHFNFPDHAAYTVQPVQEIVDFCLKQPGQVSVVMTQKDAVKWQTRELQGIWQAVPIFYIPITNQFAPHDPTFEEVATSWLG
ncbi:tetraacyldisaccharide 4'-kinase [Rufibacter sp. LB8]|nr:tetraacyldisaccharide 4'-kinase [Rufibacter sp. LB8]